MPENFQQIVKSKFPIWFRLAYSADSRYYESPFHEPHSSITARDASPASQRDAKPNCRQTGEREA